MWNAIFLFVIQTTIAGSVTTAVYLLLQPLLHKVLSAQWQYNIIKMTALFFVFPVRLAGALYVRLHNTSIPTTMAPSSQPLTHEMSPLSEHIILPVVQPIWETIPETMNTVQVGRLLFMVWIIGVLVFTVRQVLLYFVFCRETVKFNIRGDGDLKLERTLCDEIKSEMGIKKEISLVTNSKVHGPMVFLGVLNTIVLPAAAIDKQDLRYVLYHELTHIQRHDLWNKFILLCIRAIHWFNPLCYILYNQMDTWCELSCDEMVSRKLSLSERKEYGLSILNLVATSKTKENSLCTSYACNKKNLKRRLNMLLKQSKYIKTKMAFSLAAAMLIGTVGFSSGVMAANLDINSVGSASLETVKDITVLETSLKTGMPTIIQWNENLYTLDKHANMSESKDQGATWHDYLADYDTMKHLYSGFDMEMKTYEEHMVSIEQIKDRINNPDPNLVSNANLPASLVSYESVLPAWENGGAIENITMLVKQKSFDYLMPGQPVYTDEDGNPRYNGMYGNTLDHLYDSVKEQLAYWVEIGMLSQDEANTLWDEFLEQLNISHLA